MKHLQKAFSGTLPRLIAVAKEESAELMEQLQQASKANDDLSVVLAVEKDSKRLLDYCERRAQRHGAGAAAGLQMSGHECRGRLGCLLPAAKRAAACAYRPAGLPADGLKAGDGFTLLVEDPKAAAKYLKEGAKASDVPEFMREFQARGAGAGWGGRAAVALLPPGWRCAGRPGSCVLGLPAAPDRRTMRSALWLLAAGGGPGEVAEERGASRRQQRPRAGARLSHLRLIGLSSASTPGLQLPAHAHRHLHPPLPRAALRCRRSSLARRLRPTCLAVARMCSWRPMPPGGEQGGRGHSFSFLSFSPWRVFVPCLGEPGVLHCCWGLLVAV